jgi:hypothetical protein
MRYTGYTQKNGAVSKVIRNLFLTFHGHNIDRQQRQLSKFLVRYKQLASHAYCGAAGPVSKMLRFEVSRSEITVQREFCARRHRKPFPAATPSWTLALRPRSNHEKPLLVAHEKHGQFSLLTVHVVPVLGEK